MDARQARDFERRVVASYASEIEAHEAVELLIDRKIDAECVTVTHGRVEPQRGSDRIPRLLVGAVIGGLLGSVLGLTLGLGLLLLPGLALGAFVGAWTVPRNHLADLPLQIAIQRHDVLTHRDDVHEAERMLREGRFRQR
jgi:uncharacterized protein YcfJ